MAEDIFPESTMPPGWDWEIHQVRGKCPTCGAVLPELIMDCPNCHDLEND